MSNDYITVATLKKRGWTDGLIAQLLGDPDTLRPNPHYKSQAPMRLYLTARVDKVEQSPESAAFRAIAERRKARAAAANQTKQERLLAYVDGLEIEVSMMPLGRAVQHACRAYNRHQVEVAADRMWRGQSALDSHEATSLSPPEFLNRITVNYLRHELSRYEQELMRIFGKVGVAGAYMALNQKVYDAIAQTYPDLAQECSRQMDRKRREP